MTVSGTLRRALRAVRWRQSRAEARRKLAAVQTAYAHAFPTADVQQMLVEIERGRLGDQSSLKKPPVQTGGQASR